MNGDAFGSHFVSLIVIMTTTRSQVQIWLVGASAATITQYNKLPLLLNSMSVLFLSPEGTEADAERVPARQCSKKWRFGKGRHIPTAHFHDILKRLLNVSMHVFEWKRLNEAIKRRTITQIKN